jgi:hypothetical protein
VSREQHRAARRVEPAAREGQSGLREQKDQRRERECARAPVGPRRHDEPEGDERTQAQGRGNLVRAEAAARRRVRLTREAQVGGGHRAEERHGCDADRRCEQHQQKSLELFASEPHVREEDRTRRERERPREVEAELLPRLLRREVDERQ